MRRRILYIFGFFALILAVWLLIDVRTRLTLFQPNGYIQSGSALGVTVGEARLNARQKLLSEGMTLTGSQFGGTCFFRDVEPKRQLDIFFVNSWHGSMVCIVSQNERVDEVIWAFQPVSL